MSKRVLYDSQAEQAEEDELNSVPVYTRKFYQFFLGVMAFLAILAALAGLLE